MSDSSFYLSNLFGFSLLSNIIFSLVFISLLLPILLVSYFVVKWSRKCVVRFVEWRYPNVVVLEDKDIRSVLDHARNHGIFTLLIQGDCVADGLRSHLVHLTSTKRSLRSVLTTKWGLYVLKDTDFFSIDNHLVHSPCSFRGRPITESNIQDYVSDVTSKFLPLSQSPWQVHVVNCFLRGNERQICLVRVHHVLLRVEHLTLADFLPLKFSVETWNCQESDSPFTNLYNEPSALPKLHQELTENFSNYWNDFLCNNDPLERPEILKKPIGLCRFFKISIIILVSILKELVKQYRRSDVAEFPDLSCLKREAEKRNFRGQIVFGALLRSVNPIGALYLLIAWVWYLLITLTLKTPILLIRELRALKSRDKHCHSDTLTSMVWCYLPLLFRASLEVFSISSIVLTAPKLIFEQVFLKCPTSDRLPLVTSLSGRKVVSWSEEIDIEILRKIAAITEASEAEILLTVTVDAIKEYLNHTGTIIPEEILTTAKFVSQQALFVQNHEARGILCLALPIKTPLFEDDPVEILQVMQRNIREARSKQSAIYALTAAESSCGLISSCLPSIVLKVLLNHLSRRYSLTLTHVNGDLPVECVEAAMYWRPPQGNCSMSMTLHRYQNGVRLGVMCDATIGPHHTVITKAFPKRLANLATIVGVPRTPSRSPSPPPISPTTSPGY
ncbi:uncharacterized protein [Prorops nasuta]|uniref:uncharacterized protein n=1 Tax=Prorops nasuta TaxID=863751 RepID=UPI0034CE3873